MTNCAICHESFVYGDKLIANSMETFIFKPLDVPDTVNPAEVSVDMLADSRKDHRRTTMADNFFTFGEIPAPEGLFNVRHVLCSVQRTGTVINGVHPLVKHAIRYRRNAVKG